MKKKITPSKSPAPATKPAKPAAPIAAAKPTPPPAAPAVKSKAPAQVAAKKPALPVPPPAKAPVKAPTPVVKSIAPKPLVTTITAKIDIGFGNALYLRGEGAGLSWDRGLLLKCISDDHWSATLGESSRPIIFKFLVNDLSWSTGEDYVVAPGSSVNFVPTF